MTDYNKDEDYFGDNNQQAARAQELLQTAITLGEASVDYSQATSWSSSTGDGQGLTSPLTPR